VFTFGDDHWARGKENRPAVTGLFPGTRRRHERKTMKFTLTTKLAAATGLTALVLGGLLTPVAQADPIADGSKSIYGQLVGVGSDTLQDVDNGLQIAIGRVNAEAANDGLWKLASYDATGSVRFAPNADSSVGRPNGSGDGAEALLVSIGQVAQNDGKAFADSSTIYWKSDGSADDVVGDIQYSRSSSDPSTVVSTGSVSYVPFAKDAVTFATKDGKFPALKVGTIGDTANLTTGVVASSLFAIYRCEATAIVTDKVGVPQKLVKKATYINTGAGGLYNSETENLIDIVALLPQEASGTSKFWAKYFMGAEKPTMSGFPCVSRTYGSSVAVQEHSGASLTTPGSIVPFSIPKWIAMDKGLAPNVRDSAVLGSITSAADVVVAPTIGSGETLELNPTFLTNSSTDDVTRTIYHVVPYRLVDDENTLEYTMFNGPDSLVCQNTETISDYGFGLLSATEGAASCGYVGPELRAFAYSPVTVGATTITNDDVNAEFDVTVTDFDAVGSIDRGAKVRLYYTDTVSEESEEFDEQYDFEIESGSNDASFSVPYSALGEGSYDIGLVVIPNLAGAELKTSASDLTTKTLSGTEVTAKISGKVKKFGKAVVTVTPSTATGTVTIWKLSNSNGETLIGTGEILSGGKVTITNLTKQRRKGRLDIEVRYAGDADHAASSTSARWTVK